MLVLVVYDIPDDRRRYKLSKFLEGQGRRVQKSVFECFMDLEEMRRLLPKVERLVEPKEDNVRFYWMNESAMKHILTIGSQKPQPPEAAIII